MSEHRPRHRSKPGYRTSDQRKLDLNRDKAMNKNRIRTIGTFAPTAQCPECDRVFDLTDLDDAKEFYGGHDCEN